MSNKITIEIECSSCGGTGVYCGFMEPKGTGVVCIDCNGTGKAYFTYHPFERKKAKRGVQTIYLSGGKLFIAGGPRGNGIPYKEFKLALTEEEVVKLFK